MGPLPYRRVLAYIPEGKGAKYISPAFPEGLTDYEQQAYDMEYAVAGRLIPSEQAIHFRLTDTSLPASLTGNKDATSYFRIGLCKSWFLAMEADDLLPGVYGNRYGLFYSDGAQTWAKAVCVRRARFCNVVAREERQAEVRRQKVRNRR